MRRMEIKIGLPAYKIVFSLFFTVLLSVIRGVVYTYEVGIALDPMMALLAAVFCGDTYVQELSAKRAEVERLYPMKNRLRSLFWRMAAQELYLLALAAAGYGMFCLVQQPGSFSERSVEMGAEMRQFLIFLAAVAVTLLFWGLLSHTLACLFRNLWAGIGGCFLLWIMTNSTAGDRLLGSWNLFSYTFRDVENPGDFSWICGKIVCVMFCAGMAAALPRIIKKRG